MHAGEELEAHQVGKGRLSCESDAPQVGSARFDSTRVVNVNRRKTNRRKNKTLLHFFYSREAAQLVESLHHKTRFRVWIPVGSLEIIKWPIPSTGRHNVVGITTRYELDGPGIEYRWGGQDIPHLPIPALGPTQPPIQWVPGLSWG
jgi:hypothetical protein